MFLLAKTGRRMEGITDKEEYNMGEKQKRVDLKINTGNNSTHSVDKHRMSPEKQPGTGKS